MILIGVVPIQDIDSLDIIWQIPNMDKHYEYKPLNYITYLLNHESDGSIYSYLKRNGLIMTLSVGTQDDDSSCHLYKISIELTNKGFKHIPDIIECIYAYLKLIKPTESIYNEIHTMTQIDFDYSLPGEKIDYVSDLSLNMTKYKVKDIIYGPYKLNKYRDMANTLINECLSYMTKKNSIIIIMSKTFKKIATDNEKWYNAKYTNIFNPTVTALSEFTFSRIKTLPQEFKLHLPLKNSFIPKTTMLTNFEKTPIPKLMTKKHTSVYDVWYKKDSMFNIPKVYCSLILYSSQYYKTVINYLIIQIYFGILNEFLNSEMYYAQLCSSGYDIKMNQNHVQITFFGFNDTIINVVNIFMDALINLNIKESVFNFVKYDFKNNLQNFIYNPAFTLR